MHWSPKSSFLSILLWIKQIVACPIEVHIVSNLPAASVGSVFELVAMILPGIAILTTEMWF